MLTLERRIYENPNRWNREPAVDDDLGMLRFRSPGRFLLYHVTDILGVAARR